MAHFDGQSRQHLQPRLPSGEGADRAASTLSPSSFPRGLRAAWTLWLPGAPGGLPNQAFPAKGVCAQTPTPFPPPTVSRGGPFTTEVFLCVSPVPGATCARGNSQEALVYEGAMFHVPVGPERGRGKKGGFGGEMRGEPISTGQISKWVRKGSGWGSSPPRCPLERRAGRKPGQTGNDMN